jgi:hypothetical protein
VRTAAGFSGTGGCLAAMDVRRDARGLRGPSLAPARKHKDAAFLAYAPDCGNSTGGFQCV